MVKMEVFRVFSQIQNTFSFWFFFVKLESYRGLILVKTACSDHIWFFCCGLKQYRLIRLHISSNSSKCIISRSAWQFELVFGLMCKFIPVTVCNGLIIYKRFDQLNSWKVWSGDKSVRTLQSVTWFLLVDHSVELTSQKIVCVSVQSQNSLPPNVFTILLNKTFFIFL